MLEEMEMSTLMRPVTEFILTLVNLTKSELDDALIPLSSTIMPKELDWAVHPAILWGYVSCPLKEFCCRKYTPAEKDPSTKSERAEAR